MLSTLSFPSSFSLLPSGFGLSMSGLFIQVEMLLLIYLQIPGLPAVPFVFPCRPLPLKHFPFNPDILAIFGFGYLRLQYADDL